MSRLIEQILVNLSQPAGPAALRPTRFSSIDDWKQNPFQPWAVAKYRPTAYMLKTVMAYLDNLIAWGDSLFQQYTIETINEATQIYVMAANILGPEAPGRAQERIGQAAHLQRSARPTLDRLRQRHGRHGSGHPVRYLASPGSGPISTAHRFCPASVQTLYFCVPRNDQLLGYWDTVADRLFKIHNSLNLQGVFQQLPLFDPPIDPALLVRAAAAGLDVSCHRQRTQSTAAAGAVPAAGLEGHGNLPGSEIARRQLAVRDREAGQRIDRLLRAQHENTILGLANVVKYSQWQEAIKATQALEHHWPTRMQRYAYYQKLLGRTDAQIRAAFRQLDGARSRPAWRTEILPSGSSSEPQIDHGPDRIPTSRRTPLGQRRRDQDPQQP